MDTLILSVIWIEFAVIAIVSLLRGQK